jgi:hypothetical protein
VVAARGRHRQAALKSFTLAVVQPYHNVRELVRKAREPNDGSNADSSDILGSSLDETWVMANQACQWLVSVYSEGQSPHHSSLYYFVSKFNSMMVSHTLFIRFIIRSSHPKLLIVRASHPPSYCT